MAALLHGVACVRPRAACARRGASAAQPACCAAACVVPRATASLCLAPAPLRRRSRAPRAAYAAAAPPDAPPLPAVSTRRVQPCRAPAPPAFALTLAPRPQLLALEGLRHPLHAGRRRRTRGRARPRRVPSAHTHAPLAASHMRTRRCAALARPAPNLHRAPRCIPQALAETRTTGARTRRCWRLPACASSQSTCSATASGAPPWFHALYVPLRWR